MREHLTDMWGEFLEKYYWDEVIALSNAYPEKRSLFVRFEDVLKYDMHLADLLLSDPDIALSAANDALRTIDLPTGVSLENAVVRIVEIPSRLKIRDIRSEDIGRLICVDGLVLKATEVRPRMVSAAFECPHCHNVFFVFQDGSRMKEPEQCDVCGRRTRGFKLVVGKSKFINAQKIRIQESPEELRGGELPQTIDVNLEEDLTGIVSPGERVSVIGILRSYQMHNSPFFGIFIDAVSMEKKGEEFEEIEITEEDERRIKELASLPDVYERLKKSIAPFIHGYERIKEALLLQLFGGVPKELPDGTRIRGDIHILLVGDPGVAKSQMLSHIAAIAPRGIYTGGKSATSAGLTAAAVKDEFGEGRWTLEAGALVLADKGIAAIDEMDKMDKRDRDAMHEVLEQQSYHPSSELTLADGSKHKIGELVEAIFSRFTDRIVRGINCEIIRTDDLNIEILSTDFRSVFKTKVSRVSRHHAPDIFIRIRYDLGEILVTPEHPVFVFRDGRIQIVEASKVNVGDLVPAAAQHRSDSSSFTSEASRITIGESQHRRMISATRDAIFMLMRVRDIEIVPNAAEYRTKWVYDVTVEPTHTFISHGIILHNTVSIAKAGITARLNARCALLAAANPKLGRFDKYTPIAEQINMPPTLLSRFDLIFTMMDQPDEREDRETAEHILDSHIYGEMLMRNRAAMRADDSSDHDCAKHITPSIIDAELLRKYVAYARRIIPVLSEGARRKFIEFYINLRKQSYEDENAPVPVTARQLEALIRLGEARARASLRDVVTEQDAECAIILMKECLRLFVDPETGRLDVDVITIGTPKTRRDRMKTLMDIIKELQTEYRSNAVPIEEVLAIAEERGIERQKAEALIEKLKREGLLYAPRNDMVSLP